MSKHLIIAFALLVGLVLGLSQCSESPEKSAEGKMLSSTDSIQLMAKGFQLLESNCFSCHSPKPDIVEKVAPTMATVKKEYLKSAHSLGKFSSALVTFLDQPSPEKSKMPEAIQEYGLMPKMDFSDKEVRAMAFYIYNSTMEKENWYAQQYPKERSQHLDEGADSELSYEELGKKYAMRTKSVLGKNLLSAIKSRGTEHALSFCNTAAYPLTDSMARVLDVEIKRVSDKPRNPENAANKDQLAYIRNAKEQLKAGQDISPRMQEVNDKMVGYYPIMTNQMCLQCHGEPEKDIKTATLTKVNELYPDDKAINYGPNELRGIWVVQMEKSKK